MRINNAGVQQRPICTKQRGLSLVELMVGLAVGLLVVLAIISLFLNNLGSARRMIIESRVNQEMQTAADLIARDLRRAGYWTNSVNGTLATGMGNAAASNPYIPVGVNGSQITYHFSRDANDTLDAAEQYGFQLHNGIVRMQTSASTWQEITDPNVVTISALTITPVATVLPVGDVCQYTCSAGEISPEGTICPTVTIRHYTIVLQGAATAHSTIKRELRASVRLRNDQFAGVCPLS